tara:strand:- start:3657 stop:4709 length:1053 start_codon:yes stop_codon:yes gene_type:complete
MKNIIVTGGAGFIGTHTCITLLEKGYQIFVIDSFVNSSKKSLKKVLDINKSMKSQFKERLHSFEGDLNNIEFLEKVFQEIKSKHYEINGVIHFAGLKSVSESIMYPLKYWKVNVIGTLNLLELIKKYGCKNFVFSSSATIYAPRNNIKLKESFEIKPINPYGNTKATIEKILSDIFNSSKGDLNLASLRYFNPIGAHPSGLIGEYPMNIPRNIFPLIVNTALGFQKELKIYGNDYPSKDGTTVRDYIHVMDLAEIHILVLEFLMKKNGVNINLNVGTGIGTTVLELVKTFSRVNNIDVPYTFTKRRVGDIFHLVADNNLFLSKLKITPKRNIEEMCRDGWNWRKLNPKGY